MEFLEIQQQDNFISAHMHLLTKAKEYYFKAVSKWNFLKIEEFKFSIFRDQVKKKKGRYAWYKDY